MMDIQPLLAYNTWLSLPKETRIKLEKVFTIPKTGEVVVNVGSMSPEGNISGIASSDGHKPGDLYAITVPKMQELLGSDSDNFYHLFGAVLANIDELVGGTFSDKPIPPLTIAPKKRGGRPKGSKNKTNV